MITENVLIRQATSDDVPAMAGLLAELFSIEADFEADATRQRHGLEVMLDGCGKHRCVLVASAGTRVIGMGTVQLVISTAVGGPSALIEDLVVSQGYRGRGIGRQLLQAVSDWALAHGALRLQLLADAENLPALAFYANRGWVRTQLICLRKSA